MAKTNDLEIMSREPKFSGIKFAGEFKNFNGTKYMYSKLINGKLRYCGIELERKFDESSIRSWPSDDIEHLFWTSIHERFSDMEQKEVNV